MKEFFKTSASIVTSLFNTIVSLALASENLSKALLIRSEIANLKLQTSITKDVDDSDLFLEEVQSKHDNMRKKSKTIVIVVTFVVLLLIVVF